MKTKIFLLLLIVLLQACSNRQTSDALSEIIIKVETGLTPPVYLEGDPTWTIEERMEHYGVPGLSIAVIKDSKIHWAKSYGVTNKETQLPVTSQTLFQAGSISKPVAAYGALKLADLKRVDLDEDINSYLKSWKLPDSEFTKEKKVALKHLLNHSGGLTVHGFLGYSPDLPVPSLVDVLNGTPPANSGAIFVNKIPEESFRYSGGGYTVMQQMLIDLEGKSFPELMKDLVLQPLGMDNSTYNQPLTGSQLEQAASGYLPDGTMTKGERHTYPEMAAAGLWTTAEDLGAFAIDIQRTLKGKSEVVLSQTMATKMLTPFVEEFTGLGIFLNKKKDEIYFGHGGWDEGFSSEMIAHKDKGYGVVVLTNSNHPPFISELIRAVAISYGWDNYVPTHKKMASSAEELSILSGRYKVNNDDFIEIYREGDKLLRKNMRSEPAELFKISENTYTSRTNERPVKFESNLEKDSMQLLVLDPHSGNVLSTHSKLHPEDKLPIQLLESGDFEEALSAYEALMKADPNDPSISENRLNNLGYRFLGSEKLKLAQDVFKINISLYPASFNVYDSYAEASMKIGETNLAIENYKRSLSLNPENTNAVKMLEELQKK